MKVLEVIEARKWQNSTSGATASVYGAVPWTSESERTQWNVVTVGYTWLMDNGTVGLGREPAKTMEEALEVMNRINSR